MVAERVQLASRRRVPVEPRLRHEPVDDDDRAVGEGEPVGPAEAGDRPGGGEREDDRREQEDVLPGGHDVERRVAHARLPEQRHREVVEREPDDRGRAARCAGIGPSRDRHERHAEVADLDRAREERPEVRRAEQVVLPRPRLAREVVRATGERRRAASGRAGASCAPRSGTSGSGWSRRRAGRRGAPRRTNASCRSRPPTCSITAFEWTTSKLAVRKGQRAGVALDVRDPRVALAEACPVVEAERREPLGPGVALLEEVVRRAAALPARLAERDLVDADVEDGRGRVRPHRSRKSASFRLRERIEIASARRTCETLRMDHDGRAERQPRERAQGLLGRMQAACARRRADRLVRRRAAVDREPVAAAPARGQPRLVPESTTMQQPSRHLRPEIWSVTWKRPVGVGEPGAPIETRRRKTTRPSSRSVSSRFERSASTRSGPRGAGRPRCAAPSRRRRSRGRRSPRRTSCRGGRRPGAAAPSRTASSSLATASVLLPGARRIGTFAFQSTTSVRPSRRRTAGPPGVAAISAARARASATAIVPAIASREESRGA